jgi:hypothetical protein
VTIYTDLSPAALREAIQRSDPRLSATELMGQEKRKPTLREMARSFVKRVQETCRRLRERANESIIGVRNEREQVGHEL